MNGPSMEVEYFSYNFIESIAKRILSRTKYRPKLGIVCGTGLGTLVDAVEDQEIIPYSTIQGFPQSTVSGHKGNLVFGLLNSKPVVLMQGRFHIYEGYSAQKCTLPIRVMKLLGVETVFLTNASGGLNPKMKVGDLMILRDHINLAGLAGFNPLRGPNEEQFGPRFIPLSDAYDFELRKLAKECIAELGHSDFVHEGCYAMQMGPAYESIAECRMLQMWGADVVGMSTCPEVMTARHCSMRVFAMSLITNMAVLSYDATDTANHEEVLDVGRQRAEVVKAIVKEMVGKMVL